MGLRDSFRTKAIEPTSADVAAALPLPTIDSLIIPFNGTVTATREEAMSIPAVARGVSRERATGRECMAQFGPPPHL